MLEGSAVSKVGTEDDDDGSSSEEGSSAGPMVTLDLSLTIRHEGGSEEKVRNMGPPRSVRALTGTQPMKEREKVVIGGLMTRSIRQLANCGAVTKVKRQKAFFLVTIGVGAGVLFWFIILSSSFLLLAV